MIQKHQALHKLVPQIPGPPIAILNFKHIHRWGKQCDKVQKLDQTNIITMAGQPGRLAEGGSQMPPKIAVPKISQFGNTLKLQNPKNASLLRRGQDLITFKEK